MSLTKKQIFERVAEQKLTTDKALELLEGSIKKLPATLPRNPTYTKMFSYEDDILKDHKIFGQQILLGVVHCSLAVDAARAKYPKRRLHGIKKISFLDAVRINSPERACIFVEIYESAGTIQFKNTYQKNDPDQMLPTASGELVFEPVFSHAEKIDMQVLRKGAYKSVQADMLYQSQDMYGPSLFTLREVLFVHDGAIGEVRLNSMMLSQADGYAIHPALFDAACQTLLFSSSLEDSFVPLYIREVQLFHDIPGHCYCYSRIVKKTAELVIADVDYYDGEGNLLMRIAGLSIKRVASVEALIWKGSGDARQQTTVISYPEEQRRELSSKPQGGERKPKLSGVVNPGDLKRRIESYISEAVRPLLKEPVLHLDKRKNFMELGVDSTQLIQLTKQLEQDFGIELYPTLFFEYQNVEELAGHFSDKYKDVLSLHFGLRQEESSISAQISVYEEHGYIEEKVENHSELSVDAADSNEQAGEKVGSQRILSARGKRPRGRDDIAVIGMAGVFADSPDLDVFWKNLKEKKNLIREIPVDHFDYRHWFSPDTEEPDRIYCKWGSFIDDVASFDAGFFNITPKEADDMDPQLRLLLQVLYATAENAGHAPTIRGTKTGMYVGICFHDYLYEMLRLGKQVTPHMGTGSAATMMANRPSFYFNLKGPSLAVDTACSSSLVALHLACNAIRNNECEMAFAAGTNLLLGSWHYRYFCSIEALSHTGRCHTFDNKADGYVPGEGVAAVLLKPLQKAIEDHDTIHAVIRGSAINHGGYTPSVTAPSAKLEAQVIIDAWNGAGIDPQTLGYIEAHGTGTKLGDPIEIEAVKIAFNHFGVKDKTCAIGSAKAHIGHTEGAAGIAGIIKVILSMQNKEIPAMPFFEELNPFIRLEDSPLYINRNVIKWKKSGMLPRRAGVSSFGFGGTYAHVVVEEYEGPEVSRRDPEEKVEHLVVLSAKSEDRLKAYAEKMAAFLEKIDSPADSGLLNSQPCLSDIAYTLQVGREAMGERLAVVVSDTMELREKLDLYSKGKTGIGNLYRGSAKIERTDFLVDLINESRAGNQFLRTILRERQLGQLAQLWVSGIDIDRELLHGGNSGKLISLPTYAFAKVHHWFAAPAKDHDNRSCEVSRPDKRASASELREEMGTVKEPPAFTVDHVVAFLEKNISRITGISPETLDHHAAFNDIGLDSIQSMHLVRAVGTEFGLRLYVSELRTHNTLNRLAEFIREEMRNTGEQPATGAVADGGACAETYAGESVAPCSQETAANASCYGKKADIQRPLVFVFSTPRAGSTLFRVMLMGHSQIFSPPELMLLPYRTMKEWSEDLREKNWDHFKDGFIESIKELEGITPEEAVERVNEMVRNELPIEKAYQLLQDLAKGSYIIDKTPPYALEIETLYRAEMVSEHPFYIFLYRNPISVIESLVRNRFDKMMNMKADDPWILGEQTWSSMNRNILTFLSGIPKERQMRVCYEDLVRNPEAVMKSICTRLGIAFEEAMLQPHQGNRMIHGLHGGFSLSAGDPNFLSRKGIDPKLADAWKKHRDKVHLLSPQTISLAEDLGYFFHEPTRTTARTGITFPSEGRAKDNGSTATTGGVELSLPQKSIFKRMGEDPFWGIAQHHIMTIEDELDLGRLENSFKKLVQKHPVLKRYFIKRDGGWAQYEQEAALSSIVFKDLSLFDEHEKKTHLLKTEQELLESLKVDSAPLMKVAAFRYGKGRYKLMILIHMLITDGITSMLMNKELLHYYRYPEEIVHPDRRYDDYVREASALEGSGALEDHLKFWQKHVQGEPLVCPLDKQEGDDIMSSEEVLVFKYGFHDFGIEADSKMYNFFYFLMVGLYRHLSKWTGSGVPVVVFRLHRRDTGFKGDYSDVAGRFAGEVPLRMPVDPAASVEEQVKRFQELFREIPSGGLTYEMLAYKGLLPAARQVSPIVVNYQPFVSADLPQEVLDTLEVKQFESPNHTRFYQLDLIIRVNMHQITVIIKYSRHHYNDVTIRNFMSEWKQSTIAVLADNEQGLVPACNDVLHITDKGPQDAVLGG